MFNQDNKKKYEKQFLDLPGLHLGASTPTAASISFISDSTDRRFAAGLGQSFPFIGTSFHIPRVISAEK